MNGLSGMANLELLLDLLGLRSFPERRLRISILRRPSRRLEMGRLDVSLRQGGERT